MFFILWFSQPINLQSHDYRTLNFINVSLIVILPQVLHPVLETGSVAPSILLKSNIQIRHSCHNGWSWSCRQRMNTFTSSKIFSKEGPSTLDRGGWRRRPIGYIGWIPLDQRVLPLFLRGQKSRSLEGTSWRSGWKRSGLLVSRIRSKEFLLRLEWRGPDISPVPGWGLAIH